MSLLRSGLDAATSLSCGFRLTALPCELQSKILCHAIDSMCVEVLLVSSVCHQWCLPYLYRKVTLASRHALSCFLRTLKQHPEYSRYIRVLEVYSARLNWNETVTMARIIDRVQVSPAQQSSGSLPTPATSTSLPSERVKELRVRFPASDIAQALDFFCHFTPEHFEWITQPCWLLRPGELFMRFLVSNWSETLRTLRLGNFEYDASSFARSITTLPALERLTLMGSSNRMLDPDTIRTILGTGHTANHLRWLWITDCPQRRRSILERELGTAIPVHEPIVRAPKNFETSDSRSLTTADGNGEVPGRFETTAGCVKFCPRCRTQARERVMQRYSADTSATPSPSGSAELSGGIAVQSIEHANTGIDAVTRQGELTLLDAHREFVRCRVLESMRWLP